MLLCGVCPSPQASGDINSPPPSSLAGYALDRLFCDHWQILCVYNKIYVLSVNCADGTFGIRSRLKISIRTKSQKYVYTTLLPILKCIHIFGTLSSVTIFLDLIVLRSGQGNQNLILLYNGKMQNGIKTYIKKSKYAIP